jgi:hypothetical protein
MRARNLWLSVVLTVETLPTCVSPQPALEGPVLQW